MKADHRHSLIAAWERNIAPQPAAGERWAVFNAQRLPQDTLAGAGIDPATFRDTFVCEQGFRPLWLELAQAGHTCVPVFDPAIRADHALIFASRSRAMNEDAFRRAWAMVSEGGGIVICGDRKAGADGMRKWLARQFGTPESFSKHHAIVFSVRRAAGALPDTLAQGAPSDHAGMFSAAAPDAGSQLLAGFIGRLARGRVADFGAGWGYLSVELLASGARITSLALYEAEYRALEAARAALSGSTTLPVEFHWIDLVAEFRKRPFDTVVMNPPFHHGLASERRARPDIGQAFIAVAASTLVPGGKLLMVANRSLPYEPVLAAHFRHAETLAVEQGYKVFEAVR